MRFDLPALQASETVSVRFSMVLKRLAQLFFLFGLSVSLIANADQQISYRISNPSDELTAIQPFSFGQNFASGQFSREQQFQLQQVDGASKVLLQSDVKATHADGSIRHVIFSDLNPVLNSRQSNEYCLKAREGNPSQLVASLMNHVCS